MAHGTECTDIQHTHTELAIFSPVWQYSIPCGSQVVGRGAGHRQANQRGGIRWGSSGFRPPSDTESYGHPGPGPSPSPSRSSGFNLIPGSPKTTGSPGPENHCDRIPDPPSLRPMFAPTAGRPPAPHDPRLSCGIPSRVPIEPSGRGARPAHLSGEPPSLGRGHRRWDTATPWQSDQGKLETILMPHHDAFQPRIPSRVPI